MQLPIPCFYKDKEIYDRVEFKKPKTGVLTNTYETYQRSGDYPAILEFIANSITSYISIDEKTVEDKPMIKAITRRLPFQSADTLALLILAMVNVDDWIEGVYSCPRCDTRIITGVDNLDDTRDRVSDLDIINMSEYSNSVTLDLTEPVLIKHSMTGEILQEINSIEFSYPTIEDCIRGSQKYGGDKEIRREIAIYSQAIQKVNGEDVDIKWRKTWGEYVLNNLDPDDTDKRAKEMRKYGVKKSILRVCRNCGREWDAPVNTSNFFASGLRQT